MLAKLLLLPTLAAVSFSASCGSSLPAGVPPSGKIWFGSNWARKSGALVIVDKKAVFHPNDQIAWVAHFDENANKTKLTIELYSIQAGQKTSVSKQSTAVSSDTNEKALRLPVQTVVNAGASQAGKYGIAYIRGSHTLASGTFNLAK